MNSTQNKTDKDNKLADSIKEFIHEDADSITVLLRGQLLIEHYVNEILLDTLPKGSVVTEGLNFRSKLDVLKSLDLIPENIITSMIRLNHLRGTCVHDITYQEIKESEIDKIGAPLESVYRDMKRKMPKVIADDPKMRTKAIFGGLLIHIATPIIITARQHNEVKEKVDEGLKSALK